MTSHSFEPEADRYGTSAPSSSKRRAGIITLWALGIATTVIAGWLGWTMATSQPFTVKDYGYKVVSSEQVDVSFLVTKDADVKITCAITALNPGYAEVGRRDVVIDRADGPSDHERFTVSVRTSQEATTGLLDGCSVVED